MATPPLTDPDDPSDELAAEAQPPPYSVMDQEPVYGDLDVLYQDEDFAAIDKPNGLLVHRTKHDPREAAALQMTRDQLGRRLYPVHRLDRPTSGVLVFGLSKHAARELGRMFMAGEVAKTYLAIVRGYAPERDEINHPIADEDKPGERDAVTAYQRLATVELDLPAGPHATARFSLLAVFPKTGRRHQIRRHLAHIRHPIIGDVRHGDGAQNRFFREHFNLRRLFLFAMRLSFRHPFHGRTLTIQAKPPGELEALFQRFGWTEAVRDFSRATSDGSGRDLEEAG